MQKSQTELLDNLRKRRDSYEIKTLMELLEQLLRVQQLKLVTCDPTEVAVTQGKAQQLTTLISQLNKKPTKV